MLKGGGRVDENSRVKIVLVGEVMYKISDSGIILSSKSRIPGGGGGGWGEGAKL